MFCSKFNYLSQESIISFFPKREKRGPEGGPKGGPEGVQMGSKRGSRLEGPRFVPTLPGGLPGGGMLKLRFDWYIIFRRTGLAGMSNFRDAASSAILVGQCNLAENC